MRIERLLDPAGNADEGNLDVEVSGGSDGAVHDRRRRMVAAHRVNGDGNHLSQALTDLRIYEFTNLLINPPIQIRKFVNS